MKRVVLNPVYQSLSGELLLLLGEELKHPLLSIAHIAELGDKDPRITTHVQNALRMIDTVLLYKRFASGQTELRFEPVHVGSVITEVSELVKPNMTMLGCRTSLDIQHGLKPVDIDRRLFMAGFLSLWQAFIGSMHDAGEVVCSAKTASDGTIRLSLSSRSGMVEPFTLSDNTMHSKQPVTGFAGPAMDIMAAQGMFALAGAKVTHTRRKASSGIGVTLQSSRQIQFV